MTTATIEQIIEQIIEESVARNVTKALAEFVPAIPRTWEDKPTMTVKEAAAVMGLSVTAMYDITERQDFDALIRLKRKKVILTDKFFAWLIRQTDR